MFKNPYVSLDGVLKEAREQSSSGKGKARHADEGEAFEDQPIIWIERYFSSYQLGQAVKKIHESQRLKTDQAVQELLGAINYIAARIIFLRKEDARRKDNESG